ncbi:hypothetical protein SAMN05421810_102828 [Amycolatopsis arida]|uniref:DUF6801 domain-containing protein n=1 Tax=Amycolatopsis arida TaxID=587909 RepID=A0A1I5R0V8_9PSEU|nr:DUF6801 domain-containing protein [Amycolatopsis arida]TDX99028.1 hypothetical protein CLV69_101829 [Amycolatopsis arida]SFP51987.1 hypothetical protein SAMN05421810_102828 [Amycolatopsis arida]
MSRALFAKTRRIALVVASASVLALTGAVTAAAAPTATDDPVRTTGEVNKSLNFSCEFPLVGQRSVTAQITATFPDSVPAGTPIDVTGFNVAVEIDAEITDAMRLVGAATVEGTAAPNVDVDINGTPLGVRLNGMRIPSTPVPESGSMTVNIVGEVPSLTVQSAGQVSFAVGDEFSGRVTPRRADGSETSLGTFDLPCTMDAGQDPSLATVTVS